MKDLAIDNLVEALHKTVVSVKFEKVDGTERTMLCTLNPMLIPTDKMPKSEISETDKHESPTICVFEVDLQEWRSFRKENLIEWSMVG